MSKKLFFGSNLKMYKNIKDTVSYLQDLESLTKDISRDEIELFIIPSYTTLDSASKAIDQKNIRLAHKIWAGRNRDSSQERFLL